MQQAVDLADDLPRSPSPAKVKLGHCPLSNTLPGVIVCAQADGAPTEALTKALDEAFDTLSADGETLTDEEQARPS